MSKVIFFGGKEQEGKKGGENNEITLLSQKQKKQIKILCLAI